MTITEIGMRGEAKAFEFCKRLGFVCAQMDLHIINANGKSYVLEVKDKSDYEINNFEKTLYNIKDDFGTGLDVTQILKRISYQLHTGIRIILFIIEKESFRWAFLDELLQSGRFFYTRTNKAIIFPNSSFNDADKFKRLYDGEL